MAIRTPPRWLRFGGAAMLVAAPLLSHPGAPATVPVLAKIGWYFAEAGAFVFGSGLAIVPFLHGGVVDDFHWLDRAPVPRRRRGRDDHAGAGRHHGRVHRLPGRRPLRARRSPRPACSCPATSSSSSRRRTSAASRAIPQVKAFVDGVTAAATGAIAGAAFVLGRRAVIDLPTLGIFALTLLALLKLRKVPEPAVIVAAGLAGLLLRPNG